MTWGWGAMSLFLGGKQQNILGCYILHGFRRMQQELGSFKVKCSPINELYAR
jgi:hypothetical protein